jgi:hypothetical protein
VGEADFKACTPGPLDRGASSPPSRQARCHRCTDPGGTRKSCAISLTLSPRANRPAASSRSPSRRCCSAGVYPPRCAYRIPRSYARKQPTSRPGYAAIWDLCVSVGFQPGPPAPRLPDPLAWPAVLPAAQPRCGRRHQPEAAAPRSDPGPACHYLTGVPRSITSSASPQNASTSQAHFIPYRPSWPLCELKTGIRTDWSNRGDCRLGFAGPGGRPGPC